MHGAYAGALHPVDLRTIRTPWRFGTAWRFLHHKRWLYTIVANGDLIIATAVVHLGYAAHAFLTILDRRIRAMLYDESFFTAPNLAAVGDHCESGCDVHFRGPSARIAITRPVDSPRYLIAADTADASVRVEMETEHAPTPIAVVSKVPGGLLNVTEKRACMPARGAISAAGIRTQFDNALGGLDYTQGLLARHTAWRWAFAMGTSTHGQRVAFNLVDGFNSELECVLWINGAITPVHGVELQFDPSRPLDAWALRSSEGLVDVRFRADAMHAERMNVGIVRSSFVQPLGAFTGTLRPTVHEEIALKDVPGVVENQDVTW
jgi:hypothetical protein